MSTRTNSTTTLIHSGLEEWGLVRDTHGDCPGSFAVEPHVPCLLLNFKGVGKSLSYGKEDTLLIPFGNTLNMTTATLHATCILAAVGRNG